MVARLSPPKYQSNARRTNMVWLLCILWPLAWMPLVGQVQCQKQTPTVSSRVMPARANHFGKDPSHRDQATLGQIWPIISEFVVDHLGSDSHEYIEIFGLDRTDYNNATLLVIDGEGNPGQILAVFPVGTTGSAGFWATVFFNDTLPNGTTTLMCVLEFSGSNGVDLDTNNDGAFDSQPWASISDDVAIHAGDAADLVYSTVVLPKSGLAGGGPILGGASRSPYGFDTDSIGDWVGNDFDGAGLPGFPGSLQSGEAINTPGMITNIPAQDYYANADASTPVALRMSLHEIIDDHARFPYTNSFTDSWDVLNLADQDPNQSANILSIYINASYAKSPGGNSNYNREHTWPRSYGFPNNLDSNSPYTDFHQLRLANIGANGRRGSISFGTCNSGCSEETTQINNGQGGGSGVYPGNSNWYSGMAGSGSYEVWPHRRGDVARSMLYMDVRYEGDVHQIRQTPEPDLILTDLTNLIQTSGGVNTTGQAYMGRLATLLQWHEEDPVDQLERDRNIIVYAYQGNRNPFVDHPEWVDCIFNNNCAQTCISQLLEGWLIDAAPCFGGVLAITDLVAVINGDCNCP